MTMTSLSACVTITGIFLVLCVPVSVIGDTPQKLSSFADVAKALYHGAPVRFQVNNAPACSIRSPDFMAKHNIANDVNVAMVTRTQGQGVLLTWNKKIIDGAIFNTTGPVTLTTETSIFENGTVSIKTVGLEVKNFKIMFSGKLQCRWGMAGSNTTSEAVIYQQDKFGTDMIDFAALSQALNSGYSMAYNLDLSKMEPPGQGHLVGRMEYISVDETQLEFGHVLSNGTHRTDFLIQTTSTQTVVVTQLSYNVMNNQRLSTITRKGDKSSINFLRIPYDS